MTLFVPHTAGAVGVSLILEDCNEQFCREVPFALAQQEGDYGHWQGSFTMYRGLYFYWFLLQHPEDLGSGITA